MSGSMESVVLTLTVQSWVIVVPLISLCVYYRTSQSRRYATSADYRSASVIRAFYLHGRDTNRFLRSNGSISRTNYIRILVLASMDILFTLPFGIVNLAIEIRGQMSQYAYSFYLGWEYTHASWKEATGLPYNTSTGPFALASFYFTYWSNPILAFIIFGLFGLSVEARTTYWRGMFVVANWLGCKLPLHEGATSSPLETMEFGAQTTETTPPDAEMGYADQPFALKTSDEPGDTGRALPALISVHQLQRRRTFKRMSRRAQAQA